MKSAVSIFKEGRETASLQFILKPWRWKQQVYPKRSQVSVQVHGNTPFIVTAAQPAVSLQKRVDVPRNRIQEYWTPGQTT